MMCPVGMPDTIKEILWEDFKINWREYIVFFLWTVPNDIVRRRS